MEYSQEIRDEVKRRWAKRCVRAALAGAAATVAGVIALVATTVAPPPARYQEASINPPRGGDERITVRVTQEDAPAMRARVTDYLDEHNIAYEIIEGAITVERAPGQQRAHLEGLQSRPLQLSPNYRHWPGSTHADEPHYYGEGPYAARITISENAPRPAVMAATVAIITLGIATIAGAGSVALMTHSDEFVHAAMKREMRRQASAE